MNKIIWIVQDEDRHVQGVVETAEEVEDYFGKLYGSEWFKVDKTKNHWTFYSHNRLIGSATCFTLWIPAT
jgi:hypothetical protein